MPVISRASFFFLSLSLLAAALEAQVTPQGNEFLVNANTAGFQVSPDVSADALGNFVVVWGSNTPSGLGTDTDGSSIAGQLFRFDGFPTGAGGFQANTFTTGSQFSASVAMDEVGGFVVVWASGGYGVNGPDGDASGIQGRRYTFDGTPLGGEFQVNTYTSGYQVSPSVGRNDDGDFVVVWESLLFSVSVRARTFFSDGTPRSSEISLGMGFYPGVAVTQGGFAVVWSDHDASPNSAVAQRFSLDADSLGALFAVNDTKPGGFPAVASQQNAGFSVVWDSTNTGKRGILGRKLNANGTFATGEIQLDVLGTGNRPDVASDAAGNFVGVWDSSDGSGLGVRVRGVSAAGVAVGSELQVNTYTPGQQWFPAVASGDDGEVVVVWNGVDGDGPGIKGRRFQLEVPPVSSVIFADGFESGNTSAWSTTVP